MMVRIPAGGGNTWETRSASARNTGGTRRRRFPQAYASSAARNWMSIPRPANAIVLSARILKSSDRFRPTLEKPMRLPSSDDILPPAVKEVWDGRYQEEAGGGSHQEPPQQLGGGERRHPF